MRARRVPVTCVAKPVDSAGDQVQLVQCEVNNQSDSWEASASESRAPQQTLSHAGNFLSLIAQDSRDPEAIKAVSVEFFAQLLFNFTSCSVVVTAKAIGVDAPGSIPWQIMGAHFLLLFSLVGGTQKISGGHFNPMVSTMMAYWGELPKHRLPLYIVAQLAGGTLGSIMQFQLLPAELQDVAHAAVQAVPLDHTVAQAFMGEFAAAFILMFMVSVYALDKKGDPSKIPLVMAIVIPLLIYAVGPVSSMCINPARAFGPAVAANFWQHHWLWWTAPFLGGFAAIVPYKYLSQLEDLQQTGASQIVPESSYIPDQNPQSEPKAHHNLQGKEQQQSL